MAQNGHGLLEEKKDRGRMETAAILGNP